VYRSHMPCRLGGAAAGQPLDDPLERLAVPFGCGERSRSL
jgi:hypothetical protein